MRCARQQSVHNQVSSTVGEMVEVKQERHIDDSPLSAGQLYHSVVFMHVYWLCRCYLFYKRVCCVLVRQHQQVTLLPHQMLIRPTCLRKVSRTLWRLCVTGRTAPLSLILKMILLRYTVLLIVLRTHYCSLFYQCHLLTVSICQ